MQDHPEERLVLERLRILVETRLGSVSALEERLGLALGALDELRPDAAPPTPLSLRWLYQILEVLELEPKEFFSQVYELAPRVPSAGEKGEQEEGEPKADEFPPFDRVLDTVRLLVQGAQHRQGGKRS